MKKLQEQFEAIEKIKVFEIEVLDKKTGETTYILFDISINEDSLTAQHEALTEAQAQSNKIATQTIEIDTDFSLDANLANLYEVCQDAILWSDFFELTN
jgi:hypothetical protein